MYWNEDKTKSEKKNTTNNFRYFLESISLEVNRLFILIYTNQDDSVKRFNAKKYYLPKSIIKNYNAIINGKTFYNQPINSDIKRYEEIRTVTIGQGEDYTIGYLLGYEYIKNHYRLIAVALSRQKQLNAVLKAIQQIEFVGRLKNLDANGNTIDAGNDQSIFVLTILEKIKEIRLKFSQGSVTVL